MRRLLPAAWLIVLLALPATLWLLGSRQPLLESRPKEPFPPVNRSSLRDPTTFRRFDTAILDRLPGRGRALDLHARIALDLFKDSSNPDVAIGHDGYLYYVPELTPCRPGGEPVADAADAVDVLARTLVASGRRTAVVVPPSKLFTHDADAPSIDAEAERCARALEERIDRRLAQAPGGLALGPAQRALEAAGEATFLRNDTHWNWRGRELFARRVLDRLRPGLADEAGLSVGREVSRPTDLSGMLGRQRDETDRTVEATRTPPAPFAAGEVVLIGDSQTDFTFVSPFGEGVRPIRDVVLPGAVYCTWPMLADGSCDEPIKAARAILVEKVARDTQVLTSLCWRPIALLGERMSGRTASWERVDGEASPATGAALTLPANGSARVRVRIPGEDLDPRPRLLKLPLRDVPTGPDGAPVAVAMTQEPQAGGPAPCAMPAQAVAGASLFLPVPAGRRASDLVVRLDGAPGTQFGAPRIVALRGARGATG
jgi:SGNH hydrolase-like domain, acetyltransferase AlgX